MPRLWPLLSWCGILNGENNARHTPWLLNQSFPNGSLYRGVVAPKHSQLCCTSAQTGSRFRNIIRRCYGYKGMKTLKRCMFRTYNMRVANEDQRRAMMSTAQIINNQRSSIMTNWGLSVQHQNKEWYGCGIEIRLLLSDQPACH